MKDEVKHAIAQSPKGHWFNVEFGAWNAPRFQVFHFPPPFELPEHTFHPHHLEFIDPVAPPLHSSQTFSPHFFHLQPPFHCIPKHCFAISTAPNCITMNYAAFAFAVVPNRPNISNATQGNAMRVNYATNKQNNRTNNVVEDPRQFDNIYAL